MGSSYLAARRMADLDPLAHLQSTQPDETSARKNNHRLVAWWAALLSVSALAFVLEENLKSIAWGNFGSTLWNASVIVIVTPIVRWLSAPLSRLLGAGDRGGRQQACRAEEKLPARDRDHLATS